MIYCGAFLFLSLSNLKLFSLWLDLIWFLFQLLCSWLFLICLLIFNINNRFYIYIPARRVYILIGFRDRCRSINFSFFWTLFLYVIDSMGKRSGDSITRDHFRFEDDHRIPFIDLFDMIRHFFGSPPKKIF